MTIRIYHFSGTGNSLLVAKKLAGRIADAELRPITELLGGKRDATALDAEKVGFVFPIYFDRMPDVVRRAIAERPLPPARYHFAVTTSGEKTGNALSALDALLGTKGASLDYGVNIALADNSIVAKTSPDEIEHRMGRLDEQADRTAAAVTDGAKNDVVSQRSAALAAYGYVSRFGLETLYGAKHRTVDRERCVSCGLCVKLCPVGNISMSDGTLEIGDRCAWCFACLNWCPEQAVRFGRVDPSTKGQYRCPGVSANDIRQARDSSP